MGSEVFGDFGLTMQRDYDKDFPWWAVFLAGGIRGSRPTSTDLPAKQLVVSPAPGALPPSPALPLCTWRWLASPLRRVVAWQVRIIVSPRLVYRHSLDSVIETLEAAVPTLAMSVELDNVIAVAAANPVLRPRDLARYREQDRELTRRLTWFGCQEFQWAPGWVETAAKRRRRESPCDPMSVMVELKTNAALLRAVQGNLRWKGLTLAESYFLGAPPTRGRNFARLLPAILVSEHIQERSGKAQWGLVAKILHEAGWWSESSDDAIRTAVTTVAPAARQKLHRAYWEVFERERLDSSPRASEGNKSVADEARRKTKEFIRDRMRFFALMPPGVGVSLVPPKECLMSAEELGKAAADTLHRWLAFLSQRPKELDRFRLPGDPQTITLTIGETFD